MINMAALEYKNALLNCPSVFLIQITPRQWGEDYQEPYLEEQVFETHEGATMYKIWAETYLGGIKKIDIIEVKLISNYASYVRWQKGRV